MKLLVIGGTQFVGRAVVAEAAERGHDVTVFHRGSTEPQDLPSIEHVHGDRSLDLEQLAGRRWDALIDTCAYVPREVDDAASVLGRSVDLYTLVSTLAVHPDMPIGFRETSGTHRAPFPETEEIRRDTYGPLKAACEREAHRGFGERCLIIRPGFLCGPHDPTDRFTHYVRRVAAGGEMLAPGPPDAPFQILDVRDLASFMLGRIEAGDCDIYGAVGPDRPLTIAAALEEARVVAGATTQFQWADADFLISLDGPIERWFPLWDPERPELHTYDAGKAEAAGLSRRPFAQTVADTLAWDRARGEPQLRTGLPPEKEQKLLTAWSQ